DMENQSGKLDHKWQGYLASSRIQFSVQTASACASGVSVGYSFERDRANVDGDKHRVGNLALVVVERYDPASRGNHDSIDPAIVIGVVETCSAHDVDYVFMPTQQSIVAEVGNLFSCVAGDVFGKNGLEPAPFGANVRTT